MIGRRRAAEQKNAAANTRPAGTRAAGVGGSSGTMLKLYTDDVGRGFKVYHPHTNNNPNTFPNLSPSLWFGSVLIDSDPVVVMVLSLGFIASVFVLQ